jgi:hypothetical protein
MGAICRNPADSQSTSSRLRSRRDWASRDPVLGPRQLERLARSLEREHPGAAASLREKLQETLTVQRLGVDGALARTLKSTNPIENMNGAVAHHTRNVKRWRDGQMLLRWVAAALHEAQQLTSSGLQSKGRQPPEVCPWAPYPNEGCQPSCSRTSRVSAR